MIKATSNGIEGGMPPELSYVRRRRGIGALVSRVTRHLRAVHAARYVRGGERLLDIGCGDGYFIRRAACAERYGLDKLLGDEVADSLPFPAEHFDYVTMLAVIEHLSDPEKTVREIHRVLKSRGRFVFTTPRRSAEFLIRLYARDIGEEHQSYFDAERVRQLAGNRFEIVGHHTFIFGLNQVFCLEKK